MVYCVYMKKRIQRIRRHLTWRKVFLLVLIILALKLSLYLVGTVTREPWTKAIRNPGVVKEVEITYEHNDSNTARLSNIEGASGHWVGASNSEAPEIPETIWYDGAIVGSGVEIYDLSISRDGLNYAYLDIDDPGIDYMQLFVDGEEIISGYDMDIVHLPNDPSQVYYRCGDCNGKRGLFRGNEKVAEYDDFAEYEFEELLQGLCLDQPVDYVRKRLAEFLEPDVVGISCSANGKYVLKDTSKPRFPVGSYSSISVNGWPDIEGSVGSAVIDNDGRLSYTYSDGFAGGEFIISGKRYTFDRDTDGSWDWQFDVERRHVAVPFGGESGWWFDGMPTGATIGETISIENDTFYIYRISPEEGKEAT